MKFHARYALIVIVGLWTGACRQADGTIPTPDANIQEELVDVTHDLQNAAFNREAQAPEDLAHDLRKYVDPVNEPPVNELSRRAAAAVTGRNLSDQSAKQVAHDLWLSVASRDLSDRQIEALQNDIQSLLMSIGAPEASAQQVAAQVGEVQRTVTTRPRRWYELF